MIKSCVHAAIGSRHTERRDLTHTRSLNASVYRELTNKPRASWKKNIIIAAELTKTVAALKTYIFIFLLDNDLFSSSNIINFLFVSLHFRNWTVGDNSYKIFCAAKLL